MPPYLPPGAPLHHAILEIMSDLPGIAVYVQGPLPEPKPASFLSFDLVMDRLSDAPIDRSVRKHLTLMDTNVLIYTSGTTGISNSKMHAHALTRLYNIMYKNLQNRSIFYIYKNHFIQRYQRWTIIFNLLHMYQ